eukprot:3626079-Pyramimonas_sp.AAC.1
MLAAVAPPIPQGRSSLIAAAHRDHPVRTPLWCRENATPAMPWATVTDSGRAQGPPRAHPFVV